MQAAAGHHALCVCVCVPPFSSFIKRLYDALNMHGYTGFTLYLQGFWLPDFSGKASFKGYNNLASFQHVQHAVAILLYIAAKSLLFFIPIQIREDVQKLVKNEYKEFVALDYQTQFVNTVINYRIKVSATKVKLR